MKESEDLRKNTVPAANQVPAGENILFENQPGAKLSVLFVGNSITHHAPKPDIGWHGDWGMAASALEKDYVHVVLNRLQNAFGAVNACIVNAAEWERNYWDCTILEQNYQPARDFKAQIVVLRLGENVNSDMQSIHDFAEYYGKMGAFFAGDTAKMVLATDMFWRSESLNAAIQTACTAQNWRLVSIGDLGEKDENKAIGLFEHAGVAIHPGDLGMQRIGERIADTILKEMGEKHV